MVDWLAAPAAALNTKVSAPVPPVKTSRPAPATIKSAPAPPLIVSMPAPPVITSTPLPPVIVFAIVELPVKAFVPAVEVMVTPPTDDAKFKTSPPLALPVTVAAYCKALAVYVRLPNVIPLRFRVVKAVPVCVSTRLWLPVMFKVDRAVSTNVKVFADCPGTVDVRASLITRFTVSTLGAVTVPIATMAPVVTLVFKVRFNTSLAPAPVDPLKVTAVFAPVIINVPPEAVARLLIEVVWAPPVTVT